ncbi:MAG: RrF2 family transcriptional regulator [Deltaproteobacteria bacterium]|nr:RrF2 family transcriptional regulator [Deltaproteobacteria bacterium]
MKFSTKSRYGTRAMIDIAQYSNSCATMLKDIAQRMDVSPKYLDHILSSLRKAGLIINTRGKGGGYFMNRAPAQITVKDIVNAVEGEICPVECVNNLSACTKIPLCPTHDTWVAVKIAIESVLSETTVQDLIEKQHRKSSSQHTYSI